LLTYPKVRDFALTENVEIELQPGFDALTGETGAEKTSVSSFPC
jgi:DNA repair ATPase RecN